MTDTSVVKVFEHEGVLILRDQQMRTAGDSSSNMLLRAAYCQR